MWGVTHLMMLEKFYDIWMIAKILVSALEAQYKSLRGIMILINFRYL